MIFFDFFHQLIASPILVLAFILIAIVIVFNGAIDAPNSIATCVTTRTLYIDHALIMSTIFNFIGVMAIVFFSTTKVASTIIGLVNIEDSQFGINALVAALLSIVIWSVATYVLNIPTSSSHALIASIIGASLGVNNGFKDIHWHDFLKVLIGIIISVFIAYIIGRIIVGIIKLIFRKKDRRESRRIFEFGHVVSGAALSFVHGMQDGQKYIALIVILVFVANGGSKINYIPIWMGLVCAILMSVGTFIGVKRVIKYFGTNVVNLETYEGFSADIASFISIMVATFFGIPLSTTQTLTTSIMGVGSSKRKSNVNWSYAKYLSLNWFLTFPICGLLSFVITKIVMLF